MTFEETLIGQTLQQGLFIEPEKKFTAALHFQSLSSPPPPGYHFTAEYNTRPLSFVILWLGFNPKYLSGLTQMYTSAKCFCSLTEAHIFSILPVKCFCVICVHLLIRNVLPFDVRYRDQIVFPEGLNTLFISKNCTVSSGSVFTETVHFENPVFYVTFFKLHLIVLCLHAAY